MRYLRTFGNHNNYEDFIETEAFVKPNVSYCIRLNEVHYNSLDYSKDYLTIESLEDDNAIRWESSSQLSKKTISASTDNGQTWTAFTASHEGEGEEEYQPTTIATLNAGEKVLVKGENAAYFVSGNVSKFGITKNVNISGNIMSLIHGDLFENNNALTGSYCFASLFSNCSVVSAENLILPATTLPDYCYGYMFAGCTSLVTTPELPATTLAIGCYASMFRGCTSLTTAPVLPSTTLARACYGNMFQGCTSLTKVATVPSSVKPVSLNYCCKMYCQATNIQQSQDYSSYAYGCDCDIK